VGARHENEGIRRSLFFVAYVLAFIYAKKWEAQNDV
jgi:hypothetical protein